LEDDHRTLVRRIEASQTLITSAVAIYEAALAVARKKRIAVETAGEEVEILPERVGASIMPIDHGTGRLALAAQGKYGKNFGHAARLNTGDCFAYAMAKQHGVPLLHKGDDFAQTDLA
jgi:ribonuclease VapC